MSACSCVATLSAEVPVTDVVVTPSTVSVKLSPVAGVGTVTTDAPVLVGAIPASAVKVTTAVKSVVESVRVIVRTLAERLTWKFAPSPTSWVAIAVESSPDAES